MTLNEEQKAFIVCSYATYLTAKQIAERFKIEFGFDPDIIQIRGWAPSRKNGCQSRKWKPLFDDTRARFLADMSQIPIANQATRLRALNDIMEQALEKRQPKLAMEALERAAKEMGGLYTNKRELGGTVAHTHTEVPEMTDDERRNMLADRLLEAMTRYNPAGGSGATH